MQQSREGPSHLAKANIDTLREAGVDKQRIPDSDIDIVLKMPVPCFESKSTVSTSYHALKIPWTVGLAVVRKQDQTLSEAQMHRFLDTWFILRHQEREKFLGLHVARSADIKKVSRCFFSVLSTDMWR